MFQLQAKKAWLGLTNYWLLPLIFKPFGFNEALEKHQFRRGKSKESRVWIQPSEQTSLIQQILVRMCDPFTGAKSPDGLQSPSRWSAKILGELGM